MAAGFYGELVIRITSDTRAAEAGLARTAAAVEATGQRVARASQSWQQRWSKAGIAMQNLGRTMTTFVTLPTVVGFAAASASAYKYEKSLQKLQTMVSMTTEEAQRVGRQFLTMGDDFGRSAQELADAYYFISSSGYRGAEAMDILEASSKAAAAGMGDVQSIADLVTSSMSAYGKETYSATDALDIFLKTIEVGKAEPQALATSLGRIMSIAQQVDVSLEQVGGTIAAMTLTGKSTAEAVTALRGVLMALSAPAKMSIDALAEVGLTYQEVTKSLSERGLIPTLQMLYDEFDGNKLKMRQVIPNVRALAGVYDLLGANMKESMAVTAQVADSTGQLNRSFTKAQESMAYKLEAAWARIKNAFVRIGQVLLPYIAGLAEWIAKLVESFTRLDESTQKWILTILAATAALGPFLMILGSITRTIALTNILGLAKAFSSVGTAATAATVAVGPSALAIIGIGAALAAATIGVGLLVNEIRKAKMRANLTPEFQVLFDKDAFEREMKRSHWDKRVIEGVVYWDYTVVPRKKPGDDTGKTVAEQIQRGAQSAADRIAQTQDWVAKQVERLQAEAFKFGGKDSLAAIFGSGEGAYGGLAIRPRIEEYTAIIAELEKTLALGGKQFGRGFVPFKPSEIASLNSQLYLYKENLAGAQRIWDEAQAKQATLMELEPDWDFAAGRKRLREQLRQYLFDMKAYLAGDRSFLSVQPPRVDLTKSAAKVKGQVARIKQWLTNLSQTTVIPVEIKERKINATIDTIEKKLERIRIQVVRGGGWTADLKAKDKSLRDALETAKTDLQNLDASTYQPSLILDATDAKADVDAFNKEWRSIQDKSVTLTTYVKRVPIGKSAWGAIIKKPEITLVGEEGPEVIIPLTKPRRAKQLLRESGLARYTEPAVLKVAATSATASQAPPPLVENHYHSHISLPQGIVVSDVERFGRSVTPFVDSNLGVAARRRKRGVPSF